MSALDPLAALPVILEDGRTWRYRARIIRWTDGDSLWVDLLVDRGFEEMSTKRINVRLLGVDTAEKNSRDPGERERAMAAYDFVRSSWPAQLTGSAVRDGTPVTVDVVKYDKYAPRFDCIVTDLHGISISDALIRSGLGDPYDGGPR